MLGLPGTPGAVGYALIAAGLAIALPAALVAWQRLTHVSGLVSAGAVLCLAVTFGLTPFFVWRTIEDIRYTTGLDANYRRGAGPIQAFLAPYLLDPVPPLIPRGDTYFAVAGEPVPYPTARKAFPLLALNTLFPRRSVGNPREADWIVAWGVPPRTLAPVRDVRVVRPASGPLPPLFLARVR